MRSEKNSLYFRKCNFLALILKFFLYFLIFQETETLKKLLIFPETELFNPSSKNEKNPPRENFLSFRKPKARKNFSYFLKRKLFLYFGKLKPRKNFIFQETEFSYISGKGNPKKLLIFQEVKSFLYFGRWKKFLVH